MKKPYYDINDRELMRWGTVSGDLMKLRIAVLRLLVSFRRDIEKMYIQ